MQEADERSRVYSFRRSYPFLLVPTQRVSQGQSTTGYPCIRASMCVSSSLLFLSLNLYIAHHETSTDLRARHNRCTHRPLLTSRQWTDSRYLCSQRHNKER